MIRLAVIDDDDLVRNSLSMLINLEEDMEVVYKGKNGYDLVKLDGQEVDCVLLDMRMPEMSGIEALEQINFRDKVLVLSTFDEDDFVLKAVKLGAKGYILKNSEPDDIIKAIRNVVKGVSVFGQEAMDIIRESINKPQSPNTDIFSDLSQRELEVVELIAQGLSNKEIADKLFLSQGTVKNYISSIFLKTDLTHRTQIAIEWLKR